MGVQPPHDLNIDTSDFRREFLARLTNPYIPPEELKRMLYDPIPRNVGVIQCTIMRHKSGFNRLWPKYTMHLSEGDKFLLSAKKRAANKTSNYLISTDPENLNKNSASYLGKLRSNFLGTEFYIYNEGSSSKKAHTDDEVREQHGCI